VLASQRDLHTWHLQLQGRSFDATNIVVRNGALTCTLDGQQVRVHIARSDDAILLAFEGRSYRFHPEAPLSLDALGSGQAGAAGHVNLDAPMPGTIIKVLVNTGDEVDANQPLVVLEAMKMEHTVVAPYAGVVSAVPFAPGQLVSGGATLVEIEAIPS
jgi:3-methylcrotonyl-CoA carboxylase alpha subunit